MFLNFGEPSTHSGTHQINGMDRQIMGLIWMELAPIINKQTIGLLWHKSAYLVFVYS